MVFLHATTSILKIYVNHEIIPYEIQISAIQYYEFTEFTD